MDGPLVSCGCWRPAPDVRPAARMNAAGRRRPPPESLPGAAAGRQVEPVWTFPPGFRPQCGGRRPCHRGPRAPSIRAAGRFAPQMHQRRGGHADCPPTRDCGAEGLVRGGKPVDGSRPPPAVAAGGSRRAPSGANDDAGAGAHGESLPAPLPAATLHQSCRFRPVSRPRGAGAAALRPDPRRPRLRAHDWRLRSPRAWCVAAGWDGSSVAYGPLPARRAVGGGHAIAGRERPSARPPGATAGPPVRTSLAVSAASRLPRGRGPCGPRGPRRPRARRRLWCLFGN